MGHDQPSRSALTEQQERRRREWEYQKWRFSPEAAALKTHIPASYTTLVKNPGHFAVVRNAFHVVLITSKLTS